MFFVSFNKSTLGQVHGIEVGHTFLLGQKYSKPFNVLFSANNGTKTVVEMGCYGLGVTRIIAALIEANHDSFVSTVCDSV